MALKPITRQEQIIAGKNLEPITRMERFLKEYGGGSSGGGAQSDWNQTDSSAADFIKNKPFGESYGDTLTIEAIDLDTFDPSTLVGEMFLKVCDTPVTMNDLANGYSIRSGSDMFEVPPEAVGESAVQFVDGITLIYDSFLSVEEQGVGVEIEGMAFAESGIYVVADMLSYDIDITVPGFGKFMGIQKLDEKYIPVGYKNIQADWNQTDETAEDFIRNKPDSALKKLYLVDDYLTETPMGEKITIERLYEIIEKYGMPRMSIYDNPVLAGATSRDGSYYALSYYTIHHDTDGEVTFVLGKAYTSGYTSS